MIVRLNWINFFICMAKMVLFLLIKCLKALFKVIMILLCLYCICFARFHVLVQFLVL